MAFAQERLREVQAAVDAGRDPSLGRREELPRHTDSYQDLIGAMPGEQRDHYQELLKTVKDQEKVVINSIKDKLAPETQSIVNQIVGRHGCRCRSNGAAGDGNACTADGYQCPSHGHQRSSTVRASQRGARRGPAVVVLPTKTLPPPPPTSPAVQTAGPPAPTGVPPTQVAPTQGVPTQAPPTQVPPTSEAPAPTSTPRQVIQPGGGRAVTPTTPPTNTPLPEPTRTPQVLPTDTTPLPPTQTPPPPPTATRTPVTPRRR